MRKVKILFPLVHDGKSYAKNDVVEMTEKQANRLIILNVAKFINTTEKHITASDNSNKSDNAGSGNNHDDENPDGDSGDNHDDENPDGGSGDNHSDEDPNLDLDKILDLEEPSKMNKEELEAELTAAGINYSSTSKKADLIALVIQLRENK